MSLPDSLVNYYDSEVIREYNETLVGIDLIFKGPDLPKGKGSVTRPIVHKFKGKAKRGYRIREVPRETIDRDQVTVKVMESAYGFALHRKDLEAYETDGVSALNLEESLECARIVAKDVDDIIFNGDTNAGTKGIYKDAGDTFTVKTDYEWNNEVNRNPLDTIIDALTKFEASGIYDAKKAKLCLSPMAYRLAWKQAPGSGAVYMEEIAKQFSTTPDNILKSNSIDADGGLIAAFDKQVAERNVEEEANLIPFELQPNSEYPFNFETYQVYHVKKTEGFLKLRNLVADTT
ncbi:encapsulin [Methanobacterium ferruginis]|uniref:encapsulin n=1 Tax=Methanobacterium ferruginis TaxID=710191 RepID=UPI002573A53D|nr:family 1 encapsulin nanocompartment shell protein [Methanobacterium ferruginis]BDZ68593.1 hypothetical protein GCM10025860_20410 [Methanobacterium ferruginis]